MLSRLLAATGWARRSPDGGDNFPDGKRFRFRVGGEFPAEPSTISIYAQAPDGATVGRLLVADFDVSRARQAVPDADPATVVAEQADAFAALVAECGGRVVHDVSPSGGRHVYVKFARPIPFEELRDVAVALAGRYPTLDAAPMRSPSGQIRIAGSPYKREVAERSDGTFARTGRLLGYLALTLPLAEAVRVLRTPCGPKVWERLRRKLSAELVAVDPAPSLQAPLPGIVHWDPEDGRPWAPLRGGRRPLDARLAELARTGAWDAPYLQPGPGPGPDGEGGRRYASPSEARYAVLRSLAAGGWTYAEAAAEMRSGGPLVGLAGRLCGTRSPAQRRAVLTSDWDRAVAETLASRQASDPARNSHTSPATHPPTSPALEAWPLPRALTATSAAPAHVHQELARWCTAVWLAERDPVRCKGWGRRAPSIRLVLRALALARRLSGEESVAWGVRALALASGLSWRTVAEALAELREEDDPLVDLVERGRDERADRYALRIPDAYRAEAARTVAMAGRIETGHPVWLAEQLGPVCALLYEALTAVEARPVDLARRAVLSRTAVADGLAALGAHGLAERGRDGWRRGARTLDEAARELGAHALHAERVRRYRRHREEWHEFLAGVGSLAVVFEQIIAAHEAEQTLIAADQIADAADDITGLSDDVDEDVEDLEAAGRQVACGALPPSPALVTAPATVATAPTAAPAEVLAVSAPAPRPGAPPSIPAPRPAPPADQDVLPADPGQVLPGLAGGNQDVGEDQDAGDEPDETPVPPPVDAVVTVRHDATHEAAAARGAAHARALLAAARRRRS